jgi:hypothetical protein
MSYRNEGAQSDKTGDLLAARVYKDEVDNSPLTEGKPVPCEPERKGKAKPNQRYRMTVKIFDGERRRSVSYQTAELF